MKNMKGLGARSALAVAIAAAALTGCDSGDDNSGGGAGSATVQIGGGNTGGEGYSGGDGGLLSVHKYAAGGDIRVVRDGAANTAFSIPAIQPFYEGGVATINSNYTLREAFTDADEPAEGMPYYYESGYYISNGNGLIGDDPTMYVLIVNKGKTLVLEPTVDYDGSYESDDTANLELYAVENHGTIRSGNSVDGERGSIGIDVAYYLGAGTIDVAGTSNPDNTNALHGGRVSIDADVLVNEGRILAAGGNMHGGWYAGEGGDVYLEADYYLANTGDIDVRGGNASGSVGGGYGGAYGGSGGEIYLQSNFYEGQEQAPLLNSGALLASGGNGVGAGGSGGDIFVQTAHGPIYNAGNVSVDGGNASSTGYPGYGGEGYFLAEGGQVRNSGDISATGGQGIYGGSGGHIVGLSMTPMYYGYAPDAYAFPAGNVAWSGALDLRGGAGQAYGGGSGGWVAIGAESTPPWAGEGSPYGGAYGAYGGFVPSLEVNSNQPAFAQPTTVSLYGYTGVEADGGDGYYGGEGGYVLLENSGFVMIDYGVELLRMIQGGGITAELDVSARGGKGTEYGGEGGFVYMASYQPNEAPYGYASSSYDVPVVGTERVVSHEGDLDVSGGGGAYGGNGGAVVISSLDGMSSQDGDVDYAGGTGSTGDGYVGCYKLDTLVTGNGSQCSFAVEYLLEDLRQNRYPYFFNYYYGPV